jgi:hypothetical protein
MNIKICEFCFGSKFTKENDFYFKCVKCGQMYIATKEDKETGRFRR